MDSRSTDIIDNDSSTDTPPELSIENIDALLEELQQAHKEARYEGFGKRAVDVMELSHTARYTVGVIRSMLYIGIDCRLRQDFPAALQQLNAALDLAHSKDHKFLEAQLLNQISIVESLLGNTIHALELQIECYNIFKVIGTKAEISYALHQIGNTYYHLKEWTQAQNFLQQSLEIRKTLGSEWSYASTLGSLGVVYEAMGKYTEAIDYHSQALAIKEKYPQKISTAFTLHNLAKAYHHIGKTMLALELAHRSMAIKRETGNTHALTTTLCLMARIYTSMQDRNSALSYAKEALELAENIRATERICSAHEALSFVYKENKEFENALYHKEQYCELTRQHLTEESRKRFEYMTTVLGLDTARRTSEEERNRAEKLAQEIDLKNKDLTTMSLILAQKNEMLTKLRTQVEQMRTAFQGQAAETSGSDEILALEQEISAAISSEKSWEVFDQQFHTIHHEYVQKVSSLYPDLTPTELRVCAMLKLNLTTKEIANVLYISVKTVEMYRFRIRKKFGLEPSVNLSTFLASI